jgi:hypothetical protein
VAVSHLTPLVEVVVKIQSLSLGLFASILVSLVCNRVSVAQEPSKPTPEVEANGRKEAPPHSLARFVPKDTFLVVHVRPATIVKNDLLQPIVKSDAYEKLFDGFGGDIKPKDLHELLYIVASGDDPLAFPPVDFCGLMMLQKPHKGDLEIKKYFEDAGVEFDKLKKRKIGAYTCLIPPKPTTFCIAFSEDRRTIINASNEAFLEAVLSKKVVATPITKAMGTWKQGSVASLEFIADEGMTTLLQASEFPPPVIAYFSSLQSASASLDLSGDQLLTASAKFDDAEKAKQLETFAHEYLAGLKISAPEFARQFAAGLVELNEEPEAKAAELQEMIEGAIEAVSISHDEKTMALAVKRPESINKVPPLIVRVMEASQEAARRNNRIARLRELQLALLNHENATRRFQYGIGDADGKPLLSWRVMILPYIEEKELYEQFRLDEPWDSKHNMELAKQMPDIFKVDGVDDGKTTFMVFTGEQAVYSPDNLKGIRLGTISDGTSNTISIVQAGANKAVPWTKPADLVFDPDDPYAALGEMPAGGFFAAFVDSHVKAIHPDRVTAKDLKAMITRRGGETFRLD